MNAIFNVATTIQLTKTERFVQTMSVFAERSLSITRLDKELANSQLHNHNIPPVALCKKHSNCLAISQLHNDSYYFVGTGGEENFEKMLSSFEFGDLSSLRNSFFYNFIIFVASSEYNSFETICNM